MVRKTFLALGLMSLVASAVTAETTFAFKTYGGFLYDPLSPTPSMWAAPNNDFTPGGTGVEVGGDGDGPWMREGHFSSPVPWGDQDNDNKQDPRGQHHTTVWPGMAWGQPVANPWESLDIGGRSGIGFTGYGYPKADTNPGHLIKVDDDSVFAPFGSFTHINNTLDFAGSFSVTAVRNLEIRTSDGSEVVATRHYHFIVDQWETWNFDSKCPRAEPAGTSVKDSDWNNRYTALGQADIQRVMWDDPVRERGLGHTFISDGKGGTSACADPFVFRYSRDDDSDPLTVVPGVGLKDKFSHDGHDYEIIFTGLYINKNTEECGVVNYGQTANWDKLDCFTPIDTLWSAEGGAAVGYARMQINEIGGGDQGCTPGYWKQEHHFDSWPNPPYAPDQMFSTVYPCTPADGDLSLADALAAKGGGENALLRHSVAALLNTTSADVNYPNAGKITEDTCTALHGTKKDMNTLKNTYEGYNEGPEEYEGEWCPLN